MLELRHLVEGDYPIVRAIYDEGIANGIATLTTQSPDWAEWDAGHILACRWVACVENGVVGWAALSQVSRREVYAGVAEVSIYIAQQAQGIGVGKHLFGALIADSEKAGYWTLQSGILQENSVSIALHERMGFRIVGVRERLGQLRGIWRNIVLMERRSLVVGVIEQSEIV